MCVCRRSAFFNSVFLWHGFQLLFSQPKVVASSLLNSAPLKKLQGEPPKKLKLKMATEPCASLEVSQVLRLTVRRTQQECHVDPPRLTGPVMVSDGPFWALLQSVCSLLLPVFLLPLLFSFYLLYLTILGPIQKKSPLKK